MSEYTTYVGMDVHARSVACKALNPHTGETWSRSFGNCPSAETLASWMSTLPQPVYAAYESGCTGFGMCRDLRGLGVGCDIIAVSSLPRSPKERRHKCDKLDASSILREIVNPASLVTTVWVPDEETEGARDLARMRVEAAESAKAARQQMAAFLLRHKHVWNEKTATGKLKSTNGRAFESWLSSISFDDPATQTAFESYRTLVEERAAFSRRMNDLVAKEAEKPRWKPYVDAISLIKGVDVATAFLAAVEIGDFDRFPSGRRASAWLGVTPSRDSSGNKDAHGPITKEGNGRLRRCLVEGATSLARATARPKTVRPGQKFSPVVERMAAEANRRLRERYRHLAGTGKNVNKVKTAVVNEMIRWIWQIGLAVQRAER